jgi:hypothetical protein
MGWGLTRLGKIQPAETTRRLLRESDAGGDSLWVFLVTDRAGRVRSVRCVLSRQPLQDVDPARSLLLFQSGERRLLSPTAGFTLAHADFSVEPIHANAPASLLRHLEKGRAAGETVSAWFLAFLDRQPGAFPEAVSRALREFWREERPLKR